MAGSSCGCSMHITMNSFQPIVVFDGEGRLSHARLRPAKRPSGKEVPRLPAPPVARDPCQLAQDRDPTARRQSLLQSGVLDSVGPTVSITSWALRRQTTLRRHIGDLEASTKARFEDAPKQRQGAPLQGVPRRGREVEPRRAHHRPRRSLRGRTDTRFIASISTPAMRACSMRHVYCGAASRKSHTILEDAIWRRTAPHAPKPRPTSCGCSCTRALYWLMWGLRCVDAQHVQCGASAFPTRWRLRPHQKSPPDVDW